MDTKPKDEIPINHRFLILFTPSITLFAFSSVVKNYVNQTAIQIFDILELHVILQLNTNLINLNKLRSTFTNKKHQKNTT